MTFERGDVVDYTNTSSSAKFWFRCTILGVVDARHGIYLARIDRVFKSEYSWWAPGREFTAISRYFTRVPALELLGEVAE